MLILNDYPVILSDFLFRGGCLIKELEQEDIDEILVKDSLLNLLKSQIRTHDSKRVKRRFRGKIQQRKQKILNSWHQFNTSSFNVARWTVDPEQIQNVYMADRFSFITDTEI